MMREKKKTHTVSYEAGLNLREKPSLQAKIIRVLKRGETVEENGQEAPQGWIAVDGGFVMQAYLD